MELGFAAVMISLAGLYLCVHAFYKQKEHDRKYPSEAAYDPLTRVGRRRNDSRRKVRTLWIAGALVCALGFGLGVASALTSDPPTHTGR